MQKRNFNFDWTYCSLGGDGGPFAGPPKKYAVDLPYDVAITQPRTPDCPNGSAAGFALTGDYQFEKVFQIPEEDAGKSCIIEFEGVYMNAQVYVNGEYAGKNAYGYTDFYLDITELVHPGDNLIQVNAMAGMNNTSRWYTGSGIYRNVNLYVGDKTCLAPSGLRVSTVSIEDKAVLKVTGEVKGQDGPLTAALTVADPNGKEAAAATAEVTDGAFAAEIEVAAPALWSPDSPVLYTLKAALSSGDEDIVEFGIRTVEVVSSKGLLLNGEVIKLRGGCVHHDNGLIGASEYDDAAWRRVAKMKEAGFNAIRSAHNPISPSMLRACDHLGVMVMEETFDTWHTSKSPYDYTLFFDDNWKFDLEMIVKKDFNHPSVIMYAVGNEIQELDMKTGQEMNRKLAETLRGLDPTRIVTNAVNGMFIAMKHMEEIMGEILAGQKSGVDTDGPMEINNMMTMLDTYMDDIMRHHYIGDMLEAISEPLDVTGYNYMHGRYDGDTEKYPNRIIVGSETRPNSIAYNWSEVEKLPNVIGDFVWTGWDYLGEAGVGKVEYGQFTGMYGGYPWLAAYCGDFNLLGNRRSQSYFRQIVWGLRKAPYIAVQKPEHYGDKPFMSNWGWSDALNNWTWPGFEGKPIVVEVYSDADEVELLVNGEGLGKKPAGKSADYTAIYELTYAPGSVKAIAYKDGQVVGEEVLETAAPASKLQITPDRTASPADGQSLVYLDIATVDEAGRLNESVPFKVAIEVSGDAVLLGYGSADPKTEEHFFDKERTTFQGRLQAILRAPKTPGKATVTLKSDGLAEAQLEVTFE